MELLHLELFAERFVDMSRCGRLLHHFKLGKIPLLLSQFHAIARSQLTLILLFKLVDGGRLDALWRGQVQLAVHPSIVLDESLQVLLDEGHAEDVDNLWSLLIILNQQLINQVFELL